MFAELERARKDYAGFVAEFRTDKDMDEFLCSQNVDIPAGWERTTDGFQVVEDLGRILVVAFRNVDTDEPIPGATFEIPYDRVTCWA